MNKETSKIYYFALGDVLKEQGLNQAEARRKYKFDKKGPGYISRTGFLKLCNRPKQIKFEMLSLICNSMAMKPEELIRMR